MSQELEQKYFNSPLHKEVMAWQIFPIYFLCSMILYSLCIDKLQAAATVHFL